MFERESKDMAYVASVADRTQQGKEESHSSKVFRDPLGFPVRIDPSTICTRASFEHAGPLAGQRAPNTDYSMAASSGIGKKTGYDG